MIDEKSSDQLVNTGNLNFGKCLRWVVNVPVVAGRTVVGRILLLVGCAYVFLWVPDVDQALLSILHHRSIVTHSLFPALLLLFLGRRLGAAPLAGAFIGTSVHLSCDLLSPMIGFAQVWLPAPIKTPLGELSYLWLGGNAVLGFALASVILRSVISRRIAFPLVAIVSIAVGAAYGALNEESFLAIIVVLVVIAVSLLPEEYFRRRLQTSLNSNSEINDLA